MYLFGFWYANYYIGAFYYKIIKVQSKCCIDYGLECYWVKNGNLLNVVLHCIDEWIELKVEIYEIGIIEDLEGLLINLRVDDCV